MSDYKEFEGKSLDAAIAEACSYYDAPREKLEIDIVQDAKSGIFGLVGARKAIVRARRAQLPEMGKKGQDEKAPKKGRNAPAPRDAAANAPMDDSAGDGQNTQAETALTGEAPGGDAPAEENTRGRRGRKAAPASGASGASGAPGTSGTTSDKTAPEGQAGASEKEAAGEASKAKKGRRPASDKNPADKPVRQNADKASDKPQATGDDVDSQDMGLPRMALADLDQASLVQTTTSVIGKLIGGIVDDVAVEVRIGDDRVLVQINGEDTGLLIGREGQNLAAVQYLAARIISREMDAQVRVQVDAGDYHSRQDNRLKELAASLADKVRATGKSMSTKPLSAYQRRVIHLTLQDDPEIYTRSSGEGALKRVIVMRRKDA